MKILFCLRSAAAWSPFLAALTWLLLIVLASRYARTLNFRFSGSELMTVFCVSGDLVGQSRHDFKHKGHCSTSDRNRCTSRTTKSARQSQLARECLKKKTSRCSVPCSDTILHQHIVSTAHGTSCATYRVARERCDLSLVAH